jgi:N-alpha-acetyl-L-2,4-diaminobutyrate deacetylase
MIATSINYDRKGKQQGHLRVPYSYNLAGWANLMIPITVVKNGSGPTVLALAGNHGDEYQGQIALMKLARELTPEMIAGRLIIIPSMNLPAAKAGTRLSPVDGMNLNRAFPGKAEGPVTSMIADYLTRVLFPMADVVMDMHAGGRGLLFYPCSTMHVVPDLKQRNAMIDAALAWNTDFVFVGMEIAGSGLLPVEAENQGKTVITTELGGGESIPAEVHAVIQSGLRNVLIHCGVLKGDLKSRAQLGKTETIMVASLHEHDYLLASESGIFEAHVPLGKRVEPGDLIASIHFLERPDREPARIESQSRGFLLASRAPCLTQQGDCVGVISAEIDLDSLRRKKNF